MLEAEDERREFDIHAYGIELLEKLNASAASTSPAAAAAPTGELDCDDAAAAAAGAMASSSPHSVSQTASVDFASIFTTERAPAAASADGRSKKHYAGAVASNTAAARHEVCRSFLAMLQASACVCERVLIKVLMTLLQGVWISRRRSHMHDQVVR